MESPGVIVRDKVKAQNLAGDEDMAMTTSLCSNSTQAIALGGRGSCDRPNPLVFHTTVSMGCIEMDLFGHSDRPFRGSEGFSAIPDGPTNPRPICISPVLAHFRSLRHTIAMESPIQQQSWVSLTAEALSNADVRRCASCRQLKVRCSRPEITRGADT